MSVEKKQRKRKTKFVVFAVLLLTIAILPWCILAVRGASSNDIMEVTNISENEPQPNESIPREEHPEHETISENTPQLELDSEIEQELEPVLEPDDLFLDIETIAPEVKIELDRLSLRYNCAAVSLVVYDGNKREFYTYQYGYADRNLRIPVDIETKFRVASLSKLTTILVAMVLVDRGDLDLDKDISEYLEYATRSPRFRDVAITSRMLMQHTSSIFDSDSFLSSRYGNSTRSTQQLLEAGSSYRRREPGARFEYTNFGISVLAAVCEKISGKTFDQLAREVLFEPLGIDAAYVPARLHDTENIAIIYNSSHAVSRSVRTQLSVLDSDDIGHDHHLAQGNLTISAVDYAKILAMLTSDGQYRNTEILSTESVKAIHDTNVHGTGYAQGLATRLSTVYFMPGGMAFWHTGSSYGELTQYIYSSDNSNKGIVVITTGATTNRSSDGMLVVCTAMSEAAWEVLNNVPLVGFNSSSRR